MDVDQYGADYFLRGQELGISGYTDYRWLPDLTIPMASAMVSYLGVGPSDTILDFGCARGYVVRAFRDLGYNAWGYDVSRWALENADEVAKPYLIVNDSALFAGGFDWVIAKDVLEHVPQAADAVSGIMEMARRGVFAVVPLSAADGQRYVVKSYEEDVTHIHRLALATWARFFMRPGWSVTACYRVLGVKDNYAKWSEGNGFITARRIAE